MIEGVRRAYRAAVKVLASRAVSLWVMGALVGLIAVWLVPFQLTGQPETTLAGIGNDWLPLRVAYAALVVTSFACGSVRLRRDLRRMCAPLPVERPLPSEARHVIKGTLAAAREVLGKAGFEMAGGPDRVVAIQRRWSLIGGATFHLCVSFLAVGIALHGATYGSIELRLAEGQSTDLVIDTVERGDGDWEGLPSAVASLTLEEVETSFYRDVLLFDTLDATFLDERTGRRSTMSLSSPMWLDPFTTMSIQDFGLAPHIQLVEPDGGVVEEVVAVAAVFPPGGQDRVRLPFNGYTVSMIVYPDHGVVGGRDVSLSYNLDNPRILVGVEQDYPPGMMRVRRLVSLDETVPGTDLQVKVKDLRRFGELRVWRSYGWPLLVLSSLVMLAGLTSRTLFPCREIVLWPLGDGLGVAARVDGRPGPHGGDGFVEDLAERIAGRSESGDERR